MATVIRMFTPEELVLVARGAELISYMRNPKMEYVHCTASQQRNGRGITTTTENGKILAQFTVTQALIYLAVGIMDVHTEDGGQACIDFNEYANLVAYKDAEQL